MANRQHKYVVFYSFQTYDGTMGQARTRFTTNMHVTWEDLDKFETLLRQREGRNLSITGYHELPE